MTGEVSTVSASERQWAFKADQCIICIGDKRRKREKLNSITETGMRTLYGVLVNYRGILSCLLI